MLPTLRCPKSHCQLNLVRGELISRHGDKYPVVQGKPILVKHISAFHVTPPQKEKISQNIPVYSVPSHITDPNALILHLGSGNVPCPDERVISLDILPCENVDIVAESEELPFWDNSFDYVESGAVFEHLYDPIAAIKEIKRVLKPGRTFRIDTAFMQSYHGFPGHYYNLTPQAVETALVDDFTLELSCVPDSATPLWTVVSIVERFLSFLPQEDRMNLMVSPLAEVLDLIKKDLTRQNHLLASFDEYAMRSLAGSFVVIAKKPEDYELRLASIYDRGDSYKDQWESLKRDYYTARIELMIRHHEVLEYMRLCRESGYTGSELSVPEKLDMLLAGCIVRDMFDPQAIKDAIEGLHDMQGRLEKRRDILRTVYERHAQQSSRQGYPNIEASKPDAAALDFAEDNGKIRQELAARLRYILELESALKQITSTRGWRLLEKIRRFRTAAYSFFGR